MKKPMHPRCRRGAEHLAVLLEEHHASTIFSFSFSVLLWYLRHQREPTIDETTKKWSCSRATAYRWRRAFREACGTEDPYCHPDGPHVALKVAPRAAKAFGLHPWRETIYPSGGMP